MRLKDLVLRKEVESDFRVVEELTREAFGIIMCLDVMSTIYCIL